MENLQYKQGRTGSKGRTKLREESDSVGGGIG